MPRPARMNFEDVSTNSFGFAGFSLGGPRRGPQERNFVIYERSWPWERGHRVIYEGSSPWERESRVIHEGSWHWERETRVIYAGSWPWERESVVFTRDLGLGNANPA